MYSARRVNTRATNAVNGGCNTGGPSCVRVVASACWATGMPHLCYGDRARGDWRRGGGARHERSVAAGRRVGRGGARCSALLQEPARRRPARRAEQRGRDRPAARSGGRRPEEERDVSVRARAPVALAERRGAAPLPAAQGRGHAAVWRRPRSRDAVEVERGRLVKLPSVTSRAKQPGTLWHSQMAAWSNGPPGRFASSSPPCAGPPGGSSYGKAPSGLREGSWQLHRRRRGPLLDGPRDAVVGGPAAACRGGCGKAQRRLHRAPPRRRGALPLPAAWGARRRRGATSLSSCARVWKSCQRSSRSAYTPTHQRPA